jgi:uncharacterized protein with HEPN domain
MTQISGSNPSDDTSDQLREIREAQAACEAALTSLGEAQRKVDSARSWGTYDTWFGGELFSSLVKHDRIDQAESYMRTVDVALDRLRKELADVSMGSAAIGGVGVSDLTRTLDVWFDNFFSDLAVQSRLKDADHRLDMIGEALVAVRRALSERYQEVSGAGSGS